MPSVVVRSAGECRRVSVLYVTARAAGEKSTNTKRYHHGDNPNAATEPINDTELQGKVYLTLQLTGGT